MLPLLIKEWIQIRRNPFIVRLVILFPIFIMGVAPWITDMEVRNIAVSVVDNDHSALSRRLVGKIESSTYFRFSGTKPSYKAAMQGVERGEIDIVLVIPPSFEKQLTLGQIPRVLIAANATNGVKGGMGSAYLANIVSDIRLNSRPLPSPRQQTVYTHTLYNQHESYKVNMIPALMAMIMIMVCGFLPALNIVGEKEAGTIEQINVTPVKKWQFILAKLIPYWVAGLVIYSLCLLLAWAIYGIVPLGNVALLYLFAVLLALVFSSIGLIVSNYSDSMQQAMLVMWFINVCMMLLSGLFTPVRSMPEWAQALTQLVPTRHYIEAARAVFVRGTDWAGVTTQFAVLSAMAVGMSTWAVWSYKKNS